jgi:hypothetical protein
MTQSSRDGLDVGPVLRADAEMVAGMARIPTASTMLWKAKLAQARRARRLALAPITFVENVGGAAVVLIFVAALWARVSETSPQLHVFSLTLASALTGLAVAVLMTLGLCFFGERR